MKKILQSALLCLFAVAMANADPLASGYLPSINQSCPNSTANGTNSNVWITNTMTKVQQQAGSPTSACYLVVYATQNEFADFQVHVQAPSGGYSALTVTASNFVQTSPSSSTISASSTNIQVYREAYMNVTGYVTSIASTFYGVQGYYPDALIPTTDPYTSQATNAWPVAVTAGQNQSAWIDVLIPPSAPSGYYLGSITVKNSGTTIATIPVILAVWQWPSAGHMPSTATLGSEMGGIGEGFCIQVYGSYAACGYDPGVNSSNQLASKMFLDHRLSMGAGMPYETTTFTTLESYFGPLLNPTLYGASGTLLSGATLTTAEYVPNNPPAYAQNWATEASNNGWSNALYDQTVDEPQSNCTSWSNTFPWATTYHGTTPSTPVLITGNIADATTCSALNYVDWLVPIINDMDPQGGSLQRSTYNTWLAGSAGPTRKLGSYQSCSSTGTCANGTVGGSGATWPNYDIDGKPAANRVMEWLTFFHQQSFELYYAETCAWQMASCGGGSAVDPWTTVYAFGGWGDGTTIYPSTALASVNHVTQPGGAALATPIIVPSIRLKNMRDGMQDYEYMNVLTNNGEGSFVTTQINSWITNSYTFETSGSGLEAARSALGTAMHQLTYGTSYTLTVSTSGTGTGTINITNNCQSGSFTSGTTIGPCAATPNGGSVFAGWTGTLGCTGTGTCTASLTANSTMNAVFNLAPTSAPATMQGIGSIQGTAVIQ